jgi:hypothetical protein
MVEVSDADNESQRKKSKIALIMTPQFRENEDY